MNAWWLLLTAAGLAMLSLSVAGARHPYIDYREARVFRTINRLPDWLLPVLWLPMQLGNLVVGTLVGGIVAVVRGKVSIGVGVVLAVLLKLVVERVVRHRMAPFLTVRQRPGTSEPGARLRGGDVPASGPSFPSGHAILVAAIGGVVAPHVAIEWWWLLLLATAVVMLGRVYVGAHNPLDVTAGAGAGLVLGGVLSVFSS
jgi:membrane-associated phospholipid phosphatase